jgi:hypothetical protein
VSPDRDPAAGAYQGPGDNGLKAWNINSQQKKAERQHPEAENREYGQETANDEHAGNRDPELSKASLQE